MCLVMILGTGTGAVFVAETDMRTVLAGEDDEDGWLTFASVVSTSAIQGRHS